MPSKGLYMSDAVLSTDSAEVRKLKKAINSILEGDDRITRFSRFSGGYFPGWRKARSLFEIEQRGEYFHITISAEGVYWDDKGKRTKDDQISFNAFMSSIAFDSSAKETASIQRDPGNVTKFICRRSPAAVNNITNAFLEQREEWKFSVNDRYAAKLAEFQRRRYVHINGDSYVVGIDLGGTGIDVSLFKVNKDGTVGKIPVDTISMKTKKPLKELREQVAEAVSILNDRCGDKIAAVGVGMPGRFDVDGTLLPGSCPQLGSPAGIEFGGKNPKNEFEKELKSLGLEMPVFAGNDADAMFYGVIEGAVKGSIKGLVDQRGRKVTLDEMKRHPMGGLGIGTGLGNSYLYLDDLLEIHRANDGHASKILLDIEEADRARIMQAAEVIKRYNAKVPDNKKLPEFMFADDGRYIKAENLISGPGIAALAGLTNAKDFKLGIPVNVEALDLSARYIAQLLHKIYKQEAKDMSGQDWNAAGRKAASDAKIIFIGGGFGSSDEGKYLINAVSKELAKIKIGENTMLDDVLRLVTVPKDSAVLAARSATSQIPQKVIQDYLKANQAASIAI